MVLILQISRRAGEGGPPEEVAYKVVFADVVGEEIYTRRSIDVAGRLDEGVEVRTPEHGGFADDAGGDGDGVDGHVHFGVGGGEEEFFETAAEGGCREEW